MAHQLKNGRFRVQIRRRGFPPLNAVVETEAEARSLEQRHLQFLGQHGPYSEATTLREAAEAYFASSLFARKKPNTKRTERSRIKPVLAQLGEFALSHLADGKLVVQFREGRYRAKPVGTRPKRSWDGVRLELAALAAVFEWAVDQRIFVRNPMRGIRRPPGAPRTRRMQGDEDARLALVLLTEHDDEPLKEAARYVIILRELGCRPGELAGLLRADVALDNATVTFRGTKHENETRTVNASRIAIDRLAEQLVAGFARHSESAFVFTTLTRAGEPRAFEYKTAIERLRDARIVEGDFYAHAARRDFISTAFEHGVHHNDIKKQTGHASIAALEKYNQSKATHPDVRARLMREAQQRLQERVVNIADAPGLTREELIEGVMRHRGQPAYSGRIGIVAHENGAPPDEPGRRSETTDKKGGRK